MKHGKKYNESAKLIDSAKLYEVGEACDLVCKTATAKFDETVELHVRLGVDSRHADQQVRGAVVLPNGTGKTVRTLVFTKGEKIKEAQDAGSDYIADDDTVKKIQDGWMDFDVVIASPDMMGVVGRLGKVLGPRGLMPNPKAGTVTPEIGKAIADAKAGAILTMCALSIVTDALRFISRVTKAHEVNKKYIDALVRAVYADAQKA